MTKNRLYDFIIAGAGAAGLSLLWHILHTPELNKKNILLIDNSFKTLDEKTWCFWNKDVIHFPHLIRKSWNQITVKSRNCTFSQSNGNFSYHCIKASEFRRSILDFAINFKNVELVEADIQSIETINNQAVLTTTTDSYWGDWCFQSIFHAYEKQQPIKPVLQHFMGYLIEAEEKIFDPNSMVMMDFQESASNNNGTHFFYVLPYSEKKALIEYTIFSDTLLNESDYKAEIKTYIKSNLKLNEGEYRIEETEKGVIPMDNTPRKTFLNARTLCIGTSSGATKPTTGYTFTRIQQHSIEIVERLKSGQNPVDLKKSLFRFRLYDELLLKIIKNESDKTYSIFHKLFKHNKIDDVLKFLDEKSSIGEEIRIFASLPYLPFLKALVKTLPKFNAI